VSSGGSRRLSDVDETDVRIRPPRSTRPRTKSRPEHAEATSAVVVSQDRGRYNVLVPPDGRLPADLADVDPADPDVIAVIAVKARELGRRSVVVGDVVRLVGDLTGEAGSLARIVSTRERATVLRRTADDEDPVERIVVANADQLVVVTAVADPPPRPRLIDRCVAAALDAGMRPLLALTKAELDDPSALLAAYEPLGVASVVVSGLGGDQIDPRGVAAVAAELAGRVSVLVGHSGVGKSTLVNALVPGAGRVIGAVNEATGRGRHTSTGALALALPSLAGQAPEARGGWVVDTPGIRSFGLAHLSPQDLIRAFPEMEAVTVDCPRGCTHTAAAPECALDTAAAAGIVDPARLVSFRRLLDSRDRRTGD
jgi:ribosome biogenesis GTPase